MNVQPKLCHPRMMTAKTGPAPAWAPRADTAPATVLGATDGRVLALGEVP
jgi:hypothetical protein